MSLTLHARVTMIDGLTMLDSSSNGFTFHSDTATDPITSAATLETLLENFYNIASTGMSSPVSNYISRDVSRSGGATTTQWYNVTSSLSGGLGAPFATHAWDLGADAGGGRLPPGVAVTLGFRALYGSDSEHGPTASLPTGHRAIVEGAPSTHTGVTRPRARDRGRIYVGPLNPSAVKVNDPTIVGGTVQSQFITDLGKAFLKLIAEAAISAFAGNLSVWSRRAAAVKPITHFYIDEGSTYQRRREDDTVNRVHAWAPVSP